MVGYCDAIGACCRSLEVETCVGFGITWIAAAGDLFTGRIVGGDHGKERAAQGACKQFAINDFAHADAHIPIIDITWLLDAAIENAWDRDCCAGW